MFLKRLEINGFKSFADKTVLTFDYPITGIVGPNGCGKSNITDAVRWVLGEKSVKQLRGGDKDMSSIIFSGSIDRRTVNLAEVTMVFDNTERYLHYDSDEVEITRRINRRTKESEYYINKTSCRLKDIEDLTMDSGLGKDSLSVISQGNISAFADAKPEDRRAFFEEAAGVSKYKDRKDDALKKLTRTQENLERANDLIQMLEKEVIPLASAAKKAKKYLEATERLKIIETAVLVNDIDFYQEKMEEAKKAQYEAETEVSIHETTLQVNENSASEKRDEVRALDVKIQKMQEELVKTIGEIQELEKRRIEIDQRRKYAIETGNDAEKEKEMKAALEEARFEYESRKESYERLLADIVLLEQQQNELILKQIDANQLFETESNLLKRLQNRKEVLENLMKKPYSQQAGVQAIMDAIESLHGVLGVIATELHPLTNYEEAVSTALGGALYNIVTTDPEAARGAIEYLKRNRSGRATFLPRSVLDERYVNREDEIVANNTKGYLGVAAQFVSCDRQFEIVRENLLGNVLVVDDLANGNVLADLLKYRYKIVTLDGDVIHRGGSMTGGKFRESASYMSVRREYETIEAELEKQSGKSESARIKKQELIARKETMDSKLWELRMNSAKAEPVLDAKKARYEQLQDDYRLLNPEEKKETNETFRNEMIIQLENAKQNREQLEVNLRLNRDQRQKANSEAERKEQQMRQCRKELNEFKDQLGTIRTDMARVELLLDQSLQRLASEYRMTYEFAKEKVGNEVIENAKEEVQVLRKRIESLGKVNMEAPEQYEEKSARYEQQKKVFDELSESRDKLLASIKEMDEVMIKQFSEMFDKINAQFNSVFTQLFGGGKARLYLEQPDDLLNTGIEIEAHPPGKVIRNNRVLSGGEKTLIAFCVLFAILKTRPVPLCLFDEVDTALDPANNDRFAEYLKSLSNESQFIIVTHRPATMTKCDVLYGVTMAQHGVSQILKVQLDEAQKLVKEEA